MIPTDDAMRYVLAVTAPDDFGQFRMLAEWLAKEVDGKGGVGYITHIPGGSPYYARTTNVIQYYEANYPDMKALDIQSPGFDAPKTKQVVADWLTRFGDELTCIVVSYDSAQGLGVSQALEEAGRSDIKVIAAGNSKVGMDLVKAGKIHGITFQSAEADGAVPVMVAAKYFNGDKIDENAAFYLPQAVITPDDVDSYMPAQWRQIFKKHDQIIIDLCHEHGLMVIYHGCGDARAIYDNFAEMKLDAYNPLEAKALLDVVEISEQYGDRLGFCGNLDVRVLEEGNPLKIKREVLYKLTAAKGGGYIFQSDHSVSTEVNPESYALAINHLRAYGNYPLDIDGINNEIKSLTVQIGD